MRDSKRQNNFSAKAACWWSSVEEGVVLAYHAALEYHSPCDCTWPSHPISQQRSVGAARLAAANWAHHVQGVPKKMFPCLRGHNSPKKGTRNKSRVIFEILRSSSFWWALKFFIFDHGVLRKSGLKRVTPYLKTWPNWPLLQMAQISPKCP